jgi:hypothetical protein
MTRPLLSLVLVAVLPLTSVPAAAAKAPRAISWSQLASVAQRHKVDIVLPGGVELQGRISDVQSDKLLFDVLKTSDAKAFPKGVASIPRSSVRALTIRTRGNKATIIGTAAGLAAGIGLGSFANTYAHNEGDGAPGIVALIVVIPTALGFLLGYGLDSGKKTPVTITD